MRLINIHTLEIITFGDVRPPYAILSHRWRDKELSFQGFQGPAKRFGPGYDKIVRFCQLIQCFNRGEKLAPGRSGSVGLPSMTRITWAWLDTTCIDKSSSAELSEAINSMWSYYADARYCVAFLDDVHSQRPADIQHSAWFTRGWTLQELLAPGLVLFFNSKWKIIGPKSSPEMSILAAKASGIDSDILLGHCPIQRACVAQRMSWASARQTTREEDLAYCLMGLFDVNMPLLYGEGQQKAFLRLQGEIIRQNDDESIFVFYKKRNVATSGVLATHPAAFEHSSLVRRLPRIIRAPYMVTQKGLQIDGPAIRTNSSDYPEHFIIKLNCVHILRGASRHDRNESNISRSCVLAVQRRGHIFVRRPKVEEIVLHIPSREVAQRLAKNEWERIESHQFIIALTGGAAYDALPTTSVVDSRVPQIVDTLEDLYYDDDHPWSEGFKERRFNVDVKFKCVDADGPWFEGVQEGEFMVDLDQVFEL